MKRKKSRLSEILQAQKETGKSYWELIGRPLLEHYNDKGATYSDTEWDSVSWTPERFYTGVDENEDAAVGQENQRVQYAFRNGRPMPRRNNEEITQEELAAIKAARTEEAKKHPVKKYKVFPGLQKGLSREASLVDTVANGVNRQVETAELIHKSNQQAQHDAEQKRRAFARSLKTGLNATATAAELVLSGGTLLGAYGNWKNWVASGNKLKSRIANWLTSRQLPMQIGGAAIDGYQTYNAIQNENTRDAIYNATSLGLGTAGTIGAADVFRNTKPWVDRALDAAGVTQASADIVKFGYDTLFGYSAGKEQAVDQLKQYNKGKNNDVVFGGTLPEIVITAKQLNRTVNNSVEQTLQDIQRRNSLRYGMMRYIFDDSLTPPKPLQVRIQEEDEWKPIEMYKKGKPSQRLRRQIAEWEGADFAEQQGKFGDAVGKFYEWTRQQVGDKIWDKLTPNQRDALTSYRYNIKYGSFAPTVEALNAWYKTPTPENLNAVRNTINVGMNRKGMSGLRKRRLAEQDWFMEGVENLPPKEPTFDVQKPVITVSTLRKPVRQKDVTLTLEDDVQPVQDVRMPYRPTYFSNAMEEFRKSILGFNGGKNNQVVDANNAAHYMSGGVGVPIGTIEDDGDGVDYVVNVPKIDVLGTAPRGNRGEIIDGKPFVRPLQLDHTFETMLLPMAGVAAKAGGKMAYNNAMKYIDEKIMPNFGYWGDGSRAARVYGTLARRYNLPHKANYPEAYRKLRGMDEYTSARWNMSKADGNPFVSSDGRIYMGNPNMSKERMDIMSTKGGHVNFTTDQPVLDHGSNSWANGSVWAINPNAVINNETVPYLKSIEPMDMFFDGLPKQLLKYNPKDLTLISGNPSHIQFARDHGVGVLTNKNVQKLWNEARKRELQPLAKPGPAEYKEYSEALSKLTSRRGRPDVKDYQKLQDFTKLNSFVSGDKQSLQKLEKQLRKVSDGNISINDVANISLRYPNGRDVGISPRAANKHTKLLNLANFNKVWYDPAPQSEYLYFNGLYNPYGSSL